MCNRLLSIENRGSDIWPIIARSWHPRSIPFVDKKNARGNFERLGILLQVRRRKIGMERRVTIPRNMNSSDETCYLWNEIENHTCILSYFGFFIKKKSRVTKHRSTKHAKVFPFIFQNHSSKNKFPFKSTSVAFQRKKILKRKILTVEYPLSKSTNTNKKKTNFVRYRIFDQSSFSSSSSSSPLLLCSLIRC